MIEAKEGDDDKFSSQTLIPEKDYLSFTNNFQITKNNIISFSKSIGIELGVVIGRLAHDKKTYLVNSVIIRRYK